MKNIIYHHRTRAVGAEGVHIRGVQNAFKKKGYLVHDISLYNSQSEKSAEGRVNQRKFSLKSCYNLIASKLPNIVFKGFELLYNIKCYISAKKKIKSIRQKGEPIEFIYERYAYFCFSLVLIAKKYDIPLILEVNTTSYVDDVRKLYLKKVARKLEGYIFYNCSSIIVVSNYLKREINSKYNIKDGKILVTPNAVSKKDFLLKDNYNYSSLLKKTKKFAADSTIIGFVGVFVPWHGLNFLIDVFYQLSTFENSENPIKLLLVGDGPIKKNILLKIKKLNLSEKIFITGMVSHQEVKYFIDLFDIAIMPDSNPFGSPMKIFEYMAMGKALVVPDYEPISDVVIHKHNGLLFRRRNCSDCINVIENFINDKKFRMVTGKNAKKVVFNKHTWNRNIENILGHFRGMGH